jgi:Protein of unknown function DUF262
MAARKHKITPEQIEAAEAEIVDRSRRIEFYTTEYTVELLVNKMEKEDFVIPPYQREYVWDSHRKSRFVESLHMGLPIPFLFFWEMGNGKLEIVDGSQRLRTLLEYVRENLTLAPLEELPSLSGTRFSDLSPARQRKVLNRSIRGIVLNEHADDQARFDMFERINTGSKTANTAEVRRGALQGPFQAMVEELAKSDVLAELAPVSAKARSERIPDELVTRFFAYGDGTESYKDSPSRFIFEYVRKMNEAFEADASLEPAYRKRFEEMLKFVSTNFPNGFRKVENPNSTPRVRFEAIAVGSHLALTERPDLIGATIDVSGWIDGDDFKKITTSDAANVKSKLEGRINFVRNALLGAG